MPLLSSAAAVSKFCYKLKLKVFVSKRKVLIMDKRMDINFEGKKKKKMVRYKGMTNLLQATDVKNFAGSRYVEPSIYEKDHVFLFESDDSSEYQATKYVTCPGRRANVSQKPVSPSAEHKIVTSLLKKWRKENEKKAKSVVCDKSTQTINFSENISDLSKTPGCQTLPPKDSTALKYVRMRRCPSPKLKAQQSRYVKRRLPSTQKKDNFLSVPVAERTCQVEPLVEDIVGVYRPDKISMKEISDLKKAQYGGRSGNLPVVKYCAKKLNFKPRFHSTPRSPSEFKPNEVVPFVTRHHGPSHVLHGKQFLEESEGKEEEDNSWLMRTCQVEPLVEDIVGVYRPDVIDKISMKEISDLKKAQYGGRSGNLPVVKYCAKKLNFKPRFHSTPRSPSEFKPNEVVPFVTRHHGPSHVLHGKQFLEESEGKEEEDNSWLMENEGNVKNEESFQITLV